MHIGLFFGSFNPIHIGHMVLANYFIEFTSLDQVWFVVSPHNPLKEKKSLLDDYARLYLVELAIRDDNRFRKCDIEFKMPQPSFTIDTLAYLKEKHPNHKFSIIMGSDGLKNFHKWKNHETIIQNHKRFVYPRPPETLESIRMHKNVEAVDAPQMDISSTFIRKAIANNSDIRHFLPPMVYTEIDKMGYYRN
jgi:nicotinate-nucleotide adenylyltransferase